MRKLFALTLAVTVLTTGSALAASRASAPNAAFPSGSPATTNNDDSCDIGTYPAATLLLPYFEVDFRSPQTTALTTLFTVVNASRLPQIARVTIWNHWAFPVINFNIFLTGYDVQAINMYDILGRGIIAPPGGTSNQTTPGALSAANGANPNFGSTAASTCATLPGTIPTSLLNEIQSVLLTGRSNSCASAVGSPELNATGYVTIDVVSTCSTTLPTDSTYYTSQILFDNVLTGDYEQINPDPRIGNYAGGNPLVHIRAIPEGGPAGSMPATNLPYTFYDRYTNQVGVGISRTIDRRQPLPSSFAARYIQGGTGAFNTNFKIWREGVAGAGTDCSTYGRNSAMAIAEIIRFDEHELPTTFSGSIIEFPPPPPTLPASSALSTSAGTFPPMISPSGDVGGWMYLNLNNGGSVVYSAARQGFSGGTTTLGARQSQNWVIVSMFAEGRYSVDYDATSLGNGCSPAAPLSSVKHIGPAGGVPVCPAPLPCNIDYFGNSNVTP